MTPNEEMQEFLLHVSAMLQLGHLCGITVSVTTCDGLTVGKCCLSEGASKLLLLGDQIRLLDE